MTQQFNDNQLSILNAFVEENKKRLGRTKIEQFASLLIQAGDRRGRPANPETLIERDNAKQVIEKTEGKFTSATIAQELKIPRLSAHNLLTYFAKQGLIVVAGKEEKKGPGRRATEYTKAKMTQTMPHAH